MSKKTHQYDYNNLKRVMKHKTEYQKNLLSTNNIIKYKTECLNFIKADKGMIKLFEESHVLDNNSYEKYLDETFFSKFYFLYKLEILILTDIQESNTFKDFNPKDEKLFHLYNHNQALQRQWIQEFKEYHQSKALYGKDFPYTTLGGFRRASRSGSSQYEIIHKRNIDNNQYERWKETLGEKNMPNSLAEFQELKYNEKKQFDCLQEYKNIIKEGKMSPLVEFKQFYTTKNHFDDKFIGQTAVNGVKIEKVSFHFVD